MDNILNCPFCGEEGFLRKKSEYNGGTYPYIYYGVCCDTHNCIMQCNEDLIYFRSKEEAIAAWNTRPGLKE